MKKILFLATGFALITTPAYADVKSQSEAGFVVGHTAEVLGKPEEVWKRLLVPKEWWNPSHSWSGKTDGFYIDAQAGGCFCELLQDKAADGSVKPRGSVEHMRVLFTDPGKVLRMSGALGPLQSEAMQGTLTVAMEPLKGGAGTKISLSYVVGGYMRYKVADIGPAVDAMLGDQFQRLIKPLGKVVAGDAKPDDWKIDPEKLEEAKPGENAKAVDEKPAVKPDVEKPKIGKPEAKEAEKVVAPK
ncbi:MAG: hypothetical protein ABL928_09740 [Sphingorhabdus sp.]